MPYQRFYVCRIERNRLSDGSTVNFWIPGTDRKHLGHSLSPNDVPAFDGEVGYFRCMWHRKGIWMGWTVLEQVEPEPWRLEADERRSHFRYR